MDVREALKVNMKLLPVKGTYFCVLGGVASLLPYLGVYMKQIGLSAAESAIIYGTMPFLGAFMRALVGGIADKLQRHQMALLICCLLSGIFHGCLLLVPSRSIDESGVASSLQCSSSKPLFELCAPESCRGGDMDLIGNSSCHISCCSLNTEVCFGSECLPSNSTEACVSFGVDRFNVDSFSYHSNQSCVLYSPISKIIRDKKSHESLTCKGDESSKCVLKCKSEALQKCVGEQPAKFERTFWMFFTICLIGQMFFAPIFSLIDAMTYDYLGAEYEKWGHQRVWGTIGFAVFAVASGLIMDIYNTGMDGKDYTFSFIAFAVLNILASGLVFFYKISSNFQCKQIFKNMGTLLKNINVLLLMFAVFVFGAYTGLIEVFLFWHLGLLGGSQLLNGLCILVNCIPEAFVLLFAGIVIQKIGHVNCLHIAMLSYGVRLVAYSFLSNPWLVLIIEPLQAVSFGLMYAAASSYANLITPPGMSGTMQGIIGALYFGIGKGIGSILGGVIFENFGPAVTFQSYGISAFVFLIFLVIVHRCVIVPRQKLEEARKESAAEATVKEQEMAMLDSSDDKDKNAPLDDEIAPIDDPIA